MSGFNITGSSNANELELVGPGTDQAKVSAYDANGNPIAVPTKTAQPAAGQAVLVSGGIDHDTVRSMRVTRSGGAAIADHKLILNEVCEGATLNTQRWTSTATTMTAPQAATGITLNGSAITTTTTGVMLTSRQQINRVTAAIYKSVIRARLTLVANQAAEWGFGHQATLSATNAVIENGAFWRFTTAGAVVPTLAYNSTEITGTDIASSLVNTNYYDWVVILDDDRATFICARSDTGAVISEQTLRLALATPKGFSVTHLYALVRVRNNTAPASAGQMFVGEYNVYANDMAWSTPWDQQLAENAQGAQLNPTAITQAQQFANSAAPASATLSNTAAGYTTLGGLWQFAALAGAVTDYCLFGYAVPAPYRLKIKGVHIAAWNTGAPNAATPATTMVWGIGLNGASANLATGGHIRRLLGQTTIPINAAIGANANDIDVSFPEPLICEPGTTLAIILRVVAGAATASQIIQGMVDVRGVFE